MVFGIIMLIKGNESFVIREGYNLTYTLDNIPLSVVSGKGSAPVESREKTYLLCQKLQQSTRHMSRQWREWMKP